MPASSTPVLQSLSLAKLIESPWNPRKYYDAAKLKELAESLKESQATPLTVRPIAGGKFEIGAGHRRFRAAKLAGMETLLCVVKELDDEAFTKLLNIENLQRENLTPMEEARGFHDLVNRAKMDAKTIAESIGKGPDYVLKRIRLLTLDKDVARLLEEGRITVGHAVLIARFSPEQQKEIAEDTDVLFDYDDRPYPIEELENRLKADFLLELKAAPWDLADSTLAPKAGACTTCPKRTGNQGALFADLAKRDSCTDKGCFQDKGKLHLKRTVETAKAKHPDLIQISTNWNARGKDIVGSGKYSEAKKGEKGAVPAIVVEADYHESDVGKIRYVKIKKPEKSSNGTRSAAPIARRVEFGGPALVALLNAVPKQLDEAWLRQTVLQQVGFMLDAGPFEDPLFHVFGLEIEAISYHGKEKAIQKLVEKASFHQLQQLLVLQAASGSFEFLSGSGGSAKPWLQLGKVDLKKIEAAAKARAKAGKGKKLKCIGCGCTEERACLLSGIPCSWKSIDPPICTNPKCAAAKVEAAPAKKKAKAA
jgi:ParB/RepB/Spo0J family partition protein